MTFVINHGCCKDSSCISVCPVQCIRPRPGDPDFESVDQLYIDPGTCIDCGACLDECPVHAIHSDWELPEELSEYRDVNAAYFERTPLEQALPPEIVKRRLPAGHEQLSVAIVGSGPAACYAADYLSDIEGVTVSIFERLPAPFGLVRYGVAPDHPDTKLIADRFGSVLARPNVHCFLNVEVGRHVSVQELLEHHHAVLWAGGADDDRRLGIPGEELPGCLSAREFVAWYNGHPAFADHEFDLRGQRAIVIGNGNVALDVARILTVPAETLGRTDMADHAIDALARSGVTEVVVAARRGPEHAAYTTGELLALDRTEGVALRAVPGEVGTAPREDRHAEVLGAAARRDPEAGERSVMFRYGLRPESVNGEDAVESVTFRRADGTTESIDACLVLRAVGYRGRPADGLPFDEVTGTLPNRGGGVFDPVTGLPVTGVYCAGWIKRGATGVIGSNRADAAESSEAILSDLAGGRLAAPARDLGQLQELILGRQPEVVDKHAWKRIDQAERRRGRETGRSRSKLVRLPELIASARQPS